jgi:hypothetical protein
VRLYWCQLGNPNCRRLWDYIRAYYQRPFYSSLPPPKRPPFLSSQLYT